MTALVPLVEQQLAKLTAREIAAFKAGSWSSLPIDWLIENYGYPTVKKRLGPKAFYSKLNSFGSKTRRLNMGVTKQPKHYMRTGGPVRSMKTQKVYIPALVDRKYYFTQLSSTSLSDGTLMSSQLYTVGQGSTQHDRIGKEIKATNINVRYTIDFNNNTFPAGLRMMILIDKKPQYSSLQTNLYKATNNVSDNDPMDYITSGNDFHQLSYPLNTDRWTVLSDRKFDLGPNNSGPVFKRGSYNIRVNRKILYNTDLSSSQKTTPLIYALYYVEKAGGTANADTGLNFTFDLWQNFVG